MNNSLLISLRSLIISGILFLSVATSSDIVRAQQPTLPELEKQFLEELKLFRKNPAEYAKKNLDPMVNTGKKVHGKWAYPVPGTNLFYGYRAFELRDVIIEASNQLKKAPKNMPFATNAMLTEVARAFSKDWSRQPPEKYRPHVDSKGRGMGVRYREVLGNNLYSENTLNAYLKSGSNRKGYVKLTMVGWLIDDFAASRGHRLALINPKLTQFGMGFEIHGDQIYATLGMAGGVPQNTATGQSGSNPETLNSTPSRITAIKTTDEFWIVHRSTRKVLVAKNFGVVLEAKNANNESLWRWKKGNGRLYKFINVKTGKFFGTNSRTEPKMFPKQVEETDLAEWDLKTVDLLRLTSLGGEPLMYHKGSLDWGHQHS